MSGTSSGAGAASHVASLISAVEPELRGTVHAERLAAIRARIDGPLRVAIAGRVKAGKSTLLNALVGERLAPTDAGECTRIVSVYRRGPGYAVSARMRTGEAETLAFQRRDGALSISLGALSERDIDRIEVEWPATTLEAMTLIDTPGLASINDENSRRTRDFLEHDQDRPPDADAVIYLMRHLHKTDVAFLDAFMDRSVTAASPVNTVAVLSRADEIGAGRLDAMDSALRIARRYRDEATVRSLTSTVVPIAGLLAETGLTMREDEAAALRALAGHADDSLERMLLGADQLCSTASDLITVEARRDLLDRFGMFGIRVALHLVRSKGLTSAAQLAPALVEQSGVPRLRKVLDEQFGPRAKVLQARSALVALRALARDLQSSHAQISDRLDRESERIEASAVDFARVRAAHLVASGTVVVRDDERADLDRVLLSSGNGALGLGNDASGTSVQQAALRGVERWRARAGDPLAAPALVEVFETAARTCEALYSTNS